MTDLWLIALAGFLASMVDGALGMGFGPTSASILLGSGLTPAATAATVNIAKIASGLAAGVSHWRFKNIDRELVIRLAVPGAIGAAVGTAILATVDSSVLRPALALLLLGVGLRIMVRFSRPLATVDATGLSARALQGVNLRGVEVAGAAGGLTNGLVGTWGPVVTPFLLHRGLHPRFAVGSVNTAEVAVAVVSVGAMVSAGGAPGLSPGIVAAMLVGGVAGAPLAAYVVRFLPPRILGLAVAGLLLITQTRELVTAGWLPEARWALYGVIAGAVLGAALRPRGPRGGPGGRRRPTKRTRPRELRATPGSTGAAGFERDLPDQRGCQESGSATSDSTSEGNSPLSTSAIVTDSITDRTAARRPTHRSARCSLLPS